MKKEHPGRWAGPGCSAEEVFIKPEKDGRGRIQPFFRTALSIVSPVL